MACSISICLEPPSSRGCNRSPFAGWRHEPGSQDLIARRSVGGSKCRTPGLGKRCVRWLLGVPYPAEVEDLLSPLNKMQGYGRARIPDWVPTWTGGPTEDYGEAPRGDAAYRDRRSQRADHRCGPTGRTSREGASNHPAADVRRHVRFRRVGSKASGGNSKRRRARPGPNQPILRRRSCPVSN